MFWFTFSFSILHYNTQIQKKLNIPFGFHPSSHGWPWANVKTKSLRIPSSMFFALLTLNKKNPLAHVTWCIFLDGFFDESKMGKKNWLPLGSCYIPMGDSMWILVYLFTVHILYVGWSRSPKCPPNSFNTMNATHILAVCAWRRHSIPWGTHFLWHTLGMFPRL